MAVLVYLVQWIELIASVFTSLSIAIPTVLSDGDLVELGGCESTFWSCRRNLVDDWHVRELSQLDLTRSNALIVAKLAGGEDRLLALRVVRVDGRGVLLVWLPPAIVRPGIWLGLGLGHGLRHGLGHGLAFAVTVTLADQIAIARVYNIGVGGGVDRAVTVRVIRGNGRFRGRRFWRRWCAAAFRSHSLLFRGQAGAPFRVLVRLVAKLMVVGLPLDEVVVSVCELWIWRWSGCRSGCGRRVRRWVRMVMVMAKLVIPVAGACINRGSGLDGLLLLHMIRVITKLEASVGPLFRVVEPLSKLSLARLGLSLPLLHRRWARN